MFEITTAEPEDAEAIRRLKKLIAYPKPATMGEVHYFVARAKGTTIGAGSFEALANGDALMGVLAVFPGYRKQHIGRQLMLRLIAHSTDQGGKYLYTSGLYAEDYLRSFGFEFCPVDELPPELAAYNIPGLEDDCRKFMRRLLRKADCPNTSDVAATARAYFDEGFLCAESVLAAVAKHMEIDSPLIPGIATGFCNGVAATWGTCGSVSGGVLAINMVMGRQESHIPVKKNYKAVRTLIQEFQSCHGSTRCSELIACDLETKEGRRIYQNNRLRQQCREYVSTAALLSLRIISETADVPNEH